MSKLDLHTVALALGGEVIGSQVLAPGPQHSPKDRSLSVRLGPGDGGRILVHSFAGDDWQQCRDHVREKLDLASRRTSVTSGAELAALAGVHADTTAFVKRLWHGSERAAGALVETYLRGRLVIRLRQGRRDRLLDLIALIELHRNLIHSSIQRRRA